MPYQRQKGYFHPKISVSKFTWHNQNFHFVGPKYFNYEFNYFFLENSNNNESQPMYSQYLHVNSTSNSNNLSRSPSMKSTTSNLIHLTSNLRASMRSKLSHASHLILYGEESKAAKVTILVVLSILFCWAPYCIYKFSTHLNPQVNAEYFANSAFSEHFVSKHATWWQIRDAHFGCKVAWFCANVPILQQISNFPLKLN